MPKKKEKLLGRIVQKNYNNELEKVLETKDFDENVKNLLLEILYKIDVSYNDYKKVKRNVESKQKYTERIIRTIENNCDMIKVIKPNSKEAEILGDRTFSVDIKNKSIICFPIERKLLYSIAKIGKQEKIIKNKYFLISKTLSDMINIGNNINTVEPLRDFNGWSWLIIKKEIENISYNLIYQNLRILLGEEFLNSWLSNTEYVIDYYDEFVNELTEKYGSKLAKKFISILEKLSIIIETEINSKYAESLNKFQKENEEKLAIFNDKEKLIEELTRQKKDLNKKIKNLDNILSSKELLNKQYAMINENKPLEQSIFSIKVLENNIKAEKQSLLEELEEKNELLNPKKFVKEKTKLERIAELLKFANTQNNPNLQTQMLEDLQKTFLQCFLKIIDTEDAKDKIIDLIYICRYYNLLPFNEQIDIYQNIELEQNLKEVQNSLLKKAIENKIVFAPSDNMEENFKLLQYIFKTSIISLDDIYIAVIKEKDKYFVELSENNENTYEEKFEIKDLKKDSLNVKLNKKNKILN